MNLYMKLIFCYIKLVKTPIFNVFIWYDIVFLKSYVVEIGYILPYTSCFQYTHTYFSIYLSLYKKPYDTQYITWYKKNRKMILNKFMNKQLSVGTSME